VIRIRSIFLSFGDIMIKFYQVLLALLLSFSSAFAAPIEGSYFKSGVWQGEAFTSNKTGKWSHCTVYANYPNGYNLTFSLTDDYSLGVFLQNVNEPVFKGSGEFEVVTKVDNYDAMFGSVSPIDDYFAGIWFDDLDTAIWQFKKGRTLTISSKLGIVKFGLKGTFRALDAAYSCASRYQNYEDVNFKSNTNSESNSVAWIPTPEDTSAMYQLATLLISDFRLKDFVYTPPGENLIAGSVEFRANNETLLGIVAVGREKGADLDLKAIMSEDVANLTSAFCDDGDLALVNSTDNISGIETKSLRGICDSSTEPFTVYLTKQVISEKLIETVLIDYAQGSMQGSHSDTTTENLGIIAAKFVQY